MLAPKVQQLGVMVTETLEVLDTVEQLIEQHLERKHKIKQLFPVPKAQEFRTDSYLASSNGIENFAPPSKKTILS